MKLIEVIDNRNNRLFQPQKTQFQANFDTFRPKHPNFLQICPKFPKVPKRKRKKRDERKRGGKKRERKRLVHLALKGLPRFPP